MYDIYMEKILKDIVDKRIETITKKGIDFGVKIPEKRSVPVSLPDFKKGVLICEIKRGSPSEGRMNSIDDPADWAGKYISAGAGVLSILTEEDYFFGSLNDLIKIKSKYPDITVLRKDFLVNEKEIDISYLAGADMVLLIASVLIDLDKERSTGLLKSMIKRAESYGILPLIEVHNIEELNAVKMLHPKLIGINSRDLKTFRINRGYPMGLKKLIDPEIITVYESGIRNYTDAFFAGSSGFNAVLIGSSIVKSNDIVQKINEIKDGFNAGINNKGRFFVDIFHKIFIEKKLTVKICGITNIEDAGAAYKNGADIIGFIFAESPRKIDFKTAEKISRSLPSDILKAAVVVDNDIEKAVQAVRDGWIDVIQFHGEQDNDFCRSFDVNWYKAVRVKDKKDFDKSFFCPFVLYDSFSKDVMGGTGNGIIKELLEYAKSNDIDLYLAGGINPANADQIVQTYNPLMIDVSSGVEEFPGKKSHDKIRQLFEVLKKYRS